MRMIILLLTLLLPTFTLAQSGMPSRGNASVVTVNAPLTATASAGGSTDISLTVPACTNALQYSAGALACASTFTSTITSSVASGSNAFAASTGARLDLGAGVSDYIVSDGTNVSTPGTWVGYSLAADNVVAGSATNVAAAIALPNTPAGQFLTYSTTTHTFTSTIALTGGVTFTSQCPIDTPTANACEDTNFIGPYYHKAATQAFSSIFVSCSWATAGTGGTIMTARLWDVTAAAAIGTCSLGNSCAGTAAIPVSCEVAKPGTLTNAHVYTVQLVSGAGTDCTTNPGRIMCNVSAAP